MQTVDIILSLTYNEKKYPHPINWDWDSLLGLDMEEKLTVAVYHKESAQLKLFPEEISLEYQGNSIRATNV